MGNKLSYVVAAGALAALALAAAPAAAADLRAQIPFAFQVGDRALPAGTYQVSTAQGVLSVLGTDGGVFVMTGRLESTTWQRPTLVFERTGTHFVLHEAWTGGGFGRALPRTKKLDQERRPGSVAQDAKRVRVPLL